MPNDIGCLKERGLLLKEKVKQILHKKIPNKYLVYVGILIVCIFVGKRLVEDYIAYNNPKIYMQLITQNSGEESFFQTMWLVSEINSRVGCAPKYHDRQKEWSEKVLSYENHLSTDYVLPRNIHVSSEIRDGKTYITFWGTATTPEGEEEVIDKVIELSFECPLGDGWYNQKR